MARLIDKVRAFLEDRRKRRRLRRKQRKQFARWLASNPGGTYGQFYAADARRRIDAGSAHATLGITTVDREVVTRRAHSLLEGFKAAGCRPEHVVVDYGCGSLWIGEAFMDYLEPGNYIGLDVSDVFFTEALTRMPADFIARKRPTLQLIGEQSLRMVRERKPDLVFSMAVLQHVPPGELGEHFRDVVSLAAPHTRIEIGHWPRLRTVWMPPRSWRHSRYAIRAALAPLGYAPEFRPEHRLLPKTPGFSIVRR